MICCSLLNKYLLYIEGNKKMIIFNDLSLLEYDRFKRLIYSLNIVLYFVFYVIKKTFNIKDYLDEIQ